MSWLDFLFRFFKSNPLQISKHITLKEAIKSQTASRRGIDNTPGPEEIQSMKLVASMIFEPVRQFVGGPLGVSSFYRCEELNRAIRGSRTSQHVKGEAIDIDADMFGGKTNAQIFHFIKDSLTFDQLIWEFGDRKTPAWVHVSYSKSGNRKEVLKAMKILDAAGRRRTKYIPWKP